MVEKVPDKPRSMVTLISKWISLGLTVAHSYTMVEWQFSNFELNTIIDKNLADFLNGVKDEIRFCANKPQSFLTILTGAKLDLKLKEVSGIFVEDEKHQNQYILNLKFINHY